MKARLLINALLCAAACSCAAQPATTTGEFSGEKATGRATEEFDRSCSKLYDSANPAAMLIDLGLIFGPMFLMSHAPPELADMSPEKSDKTIADLRKLALRKVWLPVSAENLLGERLHSRYVKDGQIIAPEQLNSRDRKRLADVQRLLDGEIAILPSGNPYTFRLYVMQGDQTNASMGVGGYLYVTQGLLRDRSLTDSDIALRLSHEMAHLTRRHSLKDLQLKMVDSMAISKDVRGMSGFLTDPVATAQSMLSTFTSTQLLFQHFGQNQELEGDSCGMLLLAHTPGIDAAAALDNYINAKPTPGSQDWDTTHPKHEDREAVMREQLKRQQGAGATSPAAALSGPAGTASSASAGTTAPTAGAEPPKGVGAAFGGFLGKLRDALPPMPSASAP